MELARDLGVEMVPGLVKATEPVQDLEKVPDLAKEPVLDLEEAKVLVLDLAMATRIPRKLDDELPEITESLLSVLYPHYLAPIPSMSVVQFLLDPAQARLQTGQSVARESVLASKPVACNSLPLPDLLPRNHLADRIGRGAIRAPRRSRGAG